MEKLILIVGLQHSTSVATQIAKDADNVDFVFGIQQFDAVAQSNETTRSTDARTRRKEWLRIGGDTSVCVYLQ